MDHRVVFISPIIYIIVAAIVQKKAKVTYSLTRDVRGRIIRLRFLGLGLLLASLACMGFGFGQDSERAMMTWAFVGMGLMILCVFPFALANPIRVADYDNGWFKLKGCSPAFLDSLPHPPGGF